MVGHLNCRALSLRQLPVQCIVALAHPDVLVLLLAAHAPRRCEREPRQIGARLRCASACFRRARLPGLFEGVASLLLPFVHVLLGLGVGIGQRCRIGESRDAMRILQRFFAERLVFVGVGGGGLRLCCSRTGAVSTCAGSSPQDSGSRVNLEGRGSAQPPPLEKSTSSKPSPSSSRSRATCAGRTAADLGIGRSSDRMFQQHRCCIEHAGRMMVERLNGDEWGVNADQHLIESRHRLQLRRMLGHSRTSAVTCDGSSAACCGGATGSTAPCDSSCFAESANPNSCFNSRAKSRHDRACSAKDSIAALA